MDKTVECKDKARHNIRVADHMLTMTYPLVKDPKLLVTVLDNLQKATMNAIAAVLHYERQKKNIPAFSDTFDAHYTMFKAHIVPKYKIKPEWVRHIAELRELIQEHKQATTEFSRKNSFVMADKHYRLKTLDEKLLKKYLAKTKEFTHDLLLLVSKT